jgi:hypothetical protein
MLGAVIEWGGVFEQKREREREREPLVCAVVMMNENKSHNIRVSGSG